MALSLPKVEQVADAFIAEKMRLATFTLAVLINNAQFL